MGGFEAMVTLQDRAFASALIALTVVYWIRQLDMKETQLVAFTTCAYAKCATSCGL